MTPSADQKQVLSFPEVEAAGLRDWRCLNGVLHARFATGDFVTGLELVNRIGGFAEEANHHPDLELQYPHVAVKLVSHDVSGITSRDVDLARRISAAADDLGVAADPGSLSVVDFGLDTADEDAIAPFWRAVLGLGESEELSLIWFQKTESHQEPRQRFHVDVAVPPEMAQQRIDAALAAGGALVSEDRAPAYVVLADADGNKACICTSLGRD